MATASYPKISSSAWQTLRARVASAPSIRLTPSFVATLLNMASEKSAISNVVAPLRQLGLLTDEGALTERGAKWRVDGTYAEACQEILDEIYPAELLALTNGNGNLDKNQINSWFQRQGFGDSNARLMAATYVMIAEKRLPEPNGAEPKKKTVKVVAKAKPKKAASSLASEPLYEPSTEAVEAPPPSELPVKPGPNIHLDIQIHIPATATPEQIDQIFASMAKHLYR